jgi:hypothetical protein
MKVLIVTQYFWPESFVINALAELLQARGAKVSVLTGQPNYPDGVIFKGYGSWTMSRERYRGVDIFRMPLLPRGRNSRWRLAMNYMSFILSGFIVGPWILRRSISSLSMRRRRCCRPCRLSVWHAAAACLSWSGCRICGLRAFRPSHRSATVGF